MQTATISQVAYNHQQNTSFWTLHTITEKVVSLASGILSYIRGVAESLRWTRSPQLELLDTTCYTLLQALYCADFLGMLPSLLRKSFYFKERLLVIASHISMTISCLLYPLSWLHELKILSLGKGEWWVDKASRLFEGLSYLLDFFDDVRSLWKREGSWRTQVINMVSFLFWSLSTALEFLAESTIVVMVLRTLFSTLSSLCSLYLLFDALA